MGAPWRVAHIAPRDHAHQTPWPSVLSWSTSRKRPDSLICGTFGNSRWHMNYIEQGFLGPRRASPATGPLSLMILRTAFLFIRGHAGPICTLDRTPRTDCRNRHRGRAPRAALWQSKPRSRWFASQFGKSGEGSGKRLRAPAPAVAGRRQPRFC